MDKKLYEKIGRQEMLIEALKDQLSEVSSLVAKFIAGEEKSDAWEVTPQGRLLKKEGAPTKAPKPGRKPRR